MQFRINLFLALLAVILFAAWLRAPFIRAGMPYFYDEDEGHHYNRVVNMVKSGDFNPHYFLKPSLHFYLRMPVTAFGFLSAVRAGEARELKDISTRDTFGLSDYAFSASHPRIAKYNRAFSVGFSFLTVALVGVIAIQLGLNPLATLGAALITAISPALVRSSATIGVDVIVGPLVLVAIALSLAAFSRKHRGLLFAAAIAAGLATSTKYNAGIAVCVPVFTALLMRWWGTACALCAASALAFLAATPYLLVELPLFLDHVAYEIWHYGIAGHVGNEGQPGIPQALFYMNWLRTDGVGLLALILLAVSFVLTILQTRSPRAVSSEKLRAAIVALFPILYFAFMCTQKANFTRNMHVLIPFIAISAMAGAQSLSAYLGRYSALAQRAALLIVCLPLLIWSTLPARSDALSIAESRLALVEYLPTYSAAHPELARIGLAGELQIAPRTIPAPLAPTKFADSDLEQWLSQNPEVALVVLPGQHLITIPGWNKVQQFNGEPLPMRIVRNPDLALWAKASN